tara:strand:- start:162 stop:416 length:255 start_codon:yes stop_codon:yes gene_type:complete
MYFRVKIYASSKHTSIRVDGEGLIKVHIVVAPIGGNANAVMIGLIAKSLNCPKSKISIVKGHRNREELLSINGFKPEDVKKILG